MEHVQHNAPRGQKTASGREAAPCFWQSLVLLRRSVFEALDDEEFVLRCRGSTGGGVAGSLTPR